jgi:hypothetical protein
MIDQPNQLAVAVLRRQPAGGSPYDWPVEALCLVTGSRDRSALTLYIQGADGGTNGLPLHFEGELVWMVHPADSPNNPTGDEQEIQIAASPAASERYRESLASLEVEDAALTAQDKAGADDPLPPRDPRSESPLQTYPPDREEVPPDTYEYPFSHPGAEPGFKLEPEPATPVLSSGDGRVQVTLSSRHPLVPRASGSATLDLRRGGVHLSLRGIPSPLALGRNPQTDRPYNGYAVQLLAGPSGARMDLGWCERLWGDNFQMAVEKGLPLHRFDTLLVIGADRGVELQEGAPVLLMGRFRD